MLIVVVRVLIEGILVELMAVTTHIRLQQAKEVAE
jgi:hypothetical protein